MQSFFLGFLGLFAKKNEKTNQMLDMLQNPACWYSQLIMNTSMFTSSYGYLHIEVIGLYLGALVFI